MKIISYVVLVLFLGVAGLAAVYYFKSKTQDETVKLLAERVVEAEASLQTVNDSVKASDALIKSMNRELAASDNRDDAIIGRVATLEKNNAEIRDFLSMRLPPDACLLDNTCDAVSVRQAK